MTAPPVSKGKAVRNTVLILIVLATIAGSEAVFFFWMTHPPTMERRGRPPSKGLLVDITPVEVRTLSADVTAMGSVAPARRVTLTPLVSGELIDRSPALIPGGRFAKGERVAKIDPADYRLAVSTRQTELDRARKAVLRVEAQLKQAECDLELEKGRHELAREEALLLEKEIPDADRNLVMRLPQLRAAEARVNAARAAKEEAQELVTAAERGLDRAKLDEKRTEVVAPFDCVVLEKLAEKGARLSAGTPLAEIAGTQEYWIELSLPVGELKWIDVPVATDQQGSEVRIHDEAAWGPGRSRTGRVRSLLPALEPEGRMARILVTVPDPLGAEPVLTLGSYVRAVIAGRPVENIAAIPRYALHEDNTTWIMTPEDKLDIRTVELVRGDRKTVLVRGLKAGERLVISGIDTPVQDMKLRTAGAKKESKPE